jgi:PTS system mannose-specific IIB component/fructoselysine and glucoselysine-specific PTS system IIB component
MAILLYRVDERLIHGQVVVGWGNELHPDRILVVDDELAASEWEQELYALGLPSEITPHFETVESAREHLAEWESDGSRSMLLTRDVRSMARLAQGGVLRGREVNLGGLHYAPGRDAVLPYVYLSPDERDALEELVAGGIEVGARDLPGAKRVSAGRLLAKDGRGP